METKSIIIELFKEKLKNDGYIFKAGFTNCVLKKDNELVISFNNKSKYISLYYDSIKYSIVIMFIELCLNHLKKEENEK